MSRPWMAHPQKHNTRREIAEAVLFVLVLAGVIVGMSVTP